MKRLKVEGSSNIAEYGYEPTEQTLEIKFHNGNLYQYFPVTLSRYRGFTEAKSKGKYFAEHLRNNSKINYRRVDDISSDLT